MIKPFNKRLLIRRRAGITETEGGIIIPELAQEKLNDGFILDVSEGCKLKEGTHVVFGHFAGEEVEWQGEVYLLLPEEEVMCLLEDD